MRYPTKTLEGPRRIKYGKLWYSNTETIAALLILLHRFDTHETLAG